MKAPPASASSAPPTAAPRHVRFGAFEADLEARELRRDGRRVKLQGKPFDLLMVLLRQPGGFVTRETLERELWGAGTYVDFEHGLNTVVRKLREALGDDAHHPRYVETVYRQGYRFIAPVAMAAPPLSPLSAAQTAVSTAPRPHATQVRLGILAALVVLVALALVSAWFRRDRVLEAGPSAVESLAVLPLLDLSAGHDQEYFADGMTEALIAELSRLPDLKVISRTSAMTFKGSSQTLPEIAKRLGVDAVVEGSVARVGDQVRVTVQLIDARSDRHLWAQSYARGVEETLALQAELATAIARQVESHLTPEQVARWRAAAKVDRQAQDEYLRGRYFWNLRTREGFAKALEHFQAAIAADPKYALAWAGLADTYGLMPINGYDLVPPREAMPRAVEAAARALELDESLAEAHASIAWVKFNYEWDFPAAEREFQRAIELNPGYATAHQWYANLLCILGRFDEAIAEDRRALELDPLSRVINNEAGWPLGYLGRHDEAIAQYRRALELDPQYPTPHVAIGIEYEDLGRYDDAIAEYRAYGRLSGEESTAVAYVARAEALAGRRVAAVAMLRQLERDRASRYVSDYEFALVHAALRDRDGMYAALARGLEERSDFMLYLAVDSFWREYRAETRFVAILERVGLAGVHGGDAGSGRGPGPA